MPLFTPRHAIALAAACFVMAPAHAQTPFSQFTPLPSSLPTIPQAQEDQVPALQLSNPAFSQRVVASRKAQLAAGQFDSGNWDMIDTNRTGPDAGRYLFTPFETSQGGIARYDRQSGSMVTVWNAPEKSPSLKSAVALDASRWTPWGTYLTAEESWGNDPTKPSHYGRLFELLNPTTATTGTGDVVHRNAIARVSHEGLAFDRNNALYYIDELNGGSLYRFTSATPNNGATFFDAGTNAVMRIGDGNTPNATGTANWVDFTDAQGKALPGGVTITDGNGVTSVDGRATTNVAAFKGTDYQRPEDLELQTLANGDEVLYMATTTTHEVYSINLRTGRVNSFVNRATIDAATGLAVGDAFTNPDNLAIDADGNIFIVEDQPGGKADIWFARDDDRDGVAESVARWASLGTQGAEPTGLFFHPFDRSLAYVNIQHPDSGNDRLIEIRAAVPEPSTYALMGLGLFAAVGAARRNRRKAG